MLPAGQDAAEAFYRITDAAYERRSVTVTSNDAAHRMSPGALIEVPHLVDS